MSIQSSIRWRVRQSLRYLKPLFWGAKRHTKYHAYDLRRLDWSYWLMYENHRTLHRGLIQEIATITNVRHEPTTLLEIACGTGWNIDSFVQAGFDYYGWDISETALSVAMRKHPECRFWNMGVLDGKFIQDNSFDVLYNSSMLEHIGYHEEAILEMIRIAGRHLFIVFFEGLSDDSCHAVKFHPYSEQQVNGQEKDLYGRKIVLQDHRHTSEKGWYWNRYCKQEIERLVASTGCQFELLDAGNRDYIDRETILHVIL
jgi:ubiquinone/menaquinone biosynthesis C-methylase UbiE